MGIGSKRHCDEDIVEVANKYLGTSYDTVLAVFEHLEQIKLVADNLELKQGIQGNLPTVRTNADNTYTIIGHNGEITVSDGIQGIAGESTTIVDNGLTITMVDGNGNSITFDKGKTPVLGVDYFNGADGAYQTSVYRNSSTVPNTPTGGTFDGANEVPPVNWTSTPTPLNQGEFIWVSTRKYTNNGTVFIGSDWGEPQRLSGLDGYTPEKGVDYFDGGEGTFTSYIFVNSLTQPDVPIGGSYNGVETIPIGWFDDASTPTNGEFTWVSITKYVPNNSGNYINTGWSTPAKFSGDTGYTPKKGVDYFDGRDGSYNTSIFKNSINPPSVPVGGSYNGSVETIPPTWSDDAIIPSDAERTWVSVGRYTQNDIGIWENDGWSTPSAFSGNTPKKGIDYFDGVDGSFVSNIYRTDDEQPTKPTGGSFDGNVETYPTSWTDDPISPSVGQYVWMCRAVYRKNTQGMWVRDGWSTPIKFSGDSGYTPEKGIDYFDGLQGTFVSFIFKNSSAGVPLVPVGGAYDGVTEIVPSTWTDDLIAPENDAISYVSKTQYKQNDDLTWSHIGWSSPVQFLGIDGLSTNGADGVDGTPIVFHGDSTTVPTNPVNGYAYRNTSTTPAIAYVYQSGVWYQMTIDGTDGQDGTDGLSIIWKGNLASPPQNPQLNWVYRDTDNGKIYIYNGLAFELMVLDGSDGQDGTDGSDGLNVYITYHDNPVSNQPSKPVAGTGNADGWHTDATTSAIWMSQKLASDAVSGVWGEVIQLRGSDGSNAPEKYTWIVYSNSKTVGSISTSDTSLRYTGVSHNNFSNTPSNNHSDYVWYLSLDVIDLSDNTVLVNILDASHINVADIFAQNITATGSIHGASLTGTSLRTGTGPSSRIILEDGQLRVRREQGGTLRNSLWVNPSTDVMCSIQNSASTTGLSITSGGMSINADGEIRGASVTVAGNPVYHAGNPPALDARYWAIEHTQYPGLDGGNPWCRAPSSGILPSVPGGSGALGSSYWRWSIVYSITGNFTGAVTAGSFSPFTGSHVGLIPITEPHYTQGDIVSDANFVHSADINNAIFDMVVSSSPNDKKARGVYVSREPIHITEVPISLFGYSDISTLSDTHLIIHFNSVGEGMLNVIGEAGNIEAGDLIVTSSTIGKGMKQHDDIVRNITVAEAREDVVFNSIDEVKQIAVIYKCG